MRKTLECDFVVDFDVVFILVVVVGDVFVDEVENGVDDYYRLEAQTTRWRS